MQFMTIVKLFMGVTGFCIWSFMVYMDQSLQSDYLKFVISVVLGLSALALRDMPPPAKKEPDATEVKPQEPQQ